MAQDKDISDQTKVSDQGAGDSSIADKLREGSAGPAPSVVQTAQSLTGSILIQDVMNWQQRVTSLPCNVDPNGNVVSFNTQQWKEEDFQKAEELKEEIPGRVNVYRVKAQLNEKQVQQMKTIMDLEENKLD